jgi:hypothetical protein
MGFTVRQITRRVIFIRYDSAEEAAKAFLRPQEYYESPKFEKKIFTVGEYLRWYSESESGGETYAKDTQGYNIPSWVFQPFIQGLFNPLSPEEQALIETIRYRTDKYYVIGAYEGGDPDVEAHETAHGLYYTNEKYKNEVNRILSQYNLSAIKRYVKKLGYGQHVILDECHAFVVASAEWLYDSENIAVPEGLTLKLRNCLQKHLDSERSKLKNAREERRADTGEP